MDVLSLCPLPAAPLVWELLPSRWVLTVVCKATFRLEPGVLSLADEQEPIETQERHWDDDPARSLYTPSDMVPFKPRAEVLLVGSAFAKSGQPVRSLVARLSVGKVDKSIEVVSPRVRTREGEIREGKRWTKMPLAYERAAGGPGTDNPVGTGPGAPRDPYGQLPLPGLLPPGFPPDADRTPQAVGFGPIAATWPSRKAKIGRAAPDRDPALAPFGEGFDAAFFQAAPLDQQLDTIRPNERITLENLHPRHPVLVTSLPGIAPRARVELGGPPRETSFAADTLWIDTDAGICTVTFRAKVDLEHADQEGRVLIALAKGDQAIPWAKLAPAPPAPQVVSVPAAPPSPVVVPPARPSVPAAPAVSAPRGAVPPAPPSQVVVPPPRSSVSPPGLVVPSPPGSVAPPPVPPPTKIPPPPVAGTGIIEDELSESDVDIEITLSENPSRPLDETGPIRPITRPIASAASEAPALPFQPAPPGWRSPAATPSAPGAPPIGAPPTGAPPKEGLAAFGAAGSRNTLPDWFESRSVPPAPVAPSTEDLPPPPAPPPLLTSTAPWTGLPPPPPLIGAPPPGESFSALEASNAAVRAIDAPPPTLAGADPEGKPPETRPGAPPVESVVVELVWFDPLSGHLLAFLPGAPQREQPPSAAVDSRSGDGKSGDARSEDGKSPEAILAERMRARFYEALTRGAPIGIGAIEPALDSAEEESPPRPAVALVAGTLEMSFDDIEMLRALVAAATPLATSDKKLKEVIDVANEMLKAPMLGMPDFAQGLGARIREAWSKANRALPADHLSACTERLLLEQRSYQKRDLLDDTWIRALLSGGGSEVPVYLPASIAKRLPLFRRFQARLVAEIVWQQDQYETSPVALRALALGRLPARARGRPARR